MAQDTQNTEDADICNVSSLPLSPPDIIFPFGRPQRNKETKDKEDKESKGKEDDISLTFERDIELELVLKNHQFSARKRYNVRRGMAVGLSGRLELQSNSYTHPWFPILADAVSLETSIETAMYRQEIFRDLEKKEVREEVSQLLHDIDKMILFIYNKFPSMFPSGFEYALTSLLDFSFINLIDNARYYEAQRQNVFALLNKYVSFLEKAPDFSKAESSGLMAIGEYFRRVKEAEDLPRLKQFLDMAKNVETIDFKVYFNERTVPERMVVFDMKQREQAEPRKKGIKESFLERFFRKRHAEKYRKNLMASEGEVLYSIDERGDIVLNSLGRIIINFIDNYFGAILMGHFKQLTEVLQLKTPLEFYSGFVGYYDGLKQKGFETCLPQLLPKEERRMAVSSARNPLLLSSSAVLSAIVPNDITHSPEKNITLLTGPNNGGKTVYLKTIGLIQILAQSGLPVPAGSAEVSMVDGIYTHFILPDDITQGEGRYKNEIRRMREIFKVVTPYSMVLLDEPCGGTSIEDGESQSLVLLAGFHKQACAAYFASHIHPLARKIELFSAARNLQVEYEEQKGKIKFTYRIIPGYSGKSCGKEIAKEMGLGLDNLTELILKRAEEQAYTNLIR